MNFYNYLKFLKIINWIKNNLFSDNQLIFIYSKKYKEIIFDIKFTLINKIIFLIYFYLFWILIMIQGNAIF